jgi:biotin-(acetyl-CoA carboxylase) ligase
MASTPEIRITGKSPEESESILLQIRSKIPTNVRTIVGKETCTSFTSASFVESLYFNELKTVTTGRILLTSFAVDSTQSFLRDYGIISPEVVFVSDYQEEGRGRGKNSWSSPLGGLYFSFNCTCREAKNLPFIQYVICLAVIEAISREASSVLLENGITSGFIENLKIKWPNDIYYKNIKIGGILCHSSYSDGVYHVTNGIGLNLNNMAPTACINSLLCSVIEGFKYKEKKWNPPNLLNLEKIGKEKLLAKILGKTRNALVEETNNHTIQNILKITMRSSIPRVSKL